MPKYSNYRSAVRKRWVRWSLHYLAWSLSIGIVTALSLLYSDPQQSEEGLGRLFLTGQFLVVVRMTVLTIGVWETVRFVWKRPFRWWMRSGIYVLSSFIWFILNDAYHLTLNSLAGDTGIIDRQNQPWSYALFWMGMIGAVVINFYLTARNRDRETAALEVKNSHLSAQLVKLQLQTLKSQLQPHFLFNTHNSIATLIRKGDRDLALKMIVALSDLLRYTLANEQTQFVSLRNELKFLTDYLDLEQIRFQGRIRIDMEIDDSAIDLRVPNMILQPLVENAVRHGSSERMTSGTLSICGNVSDDRLVLEVYNDGPLLSAGWRMDRQTGIGIRNTMERLEKHYGQDFDFELRNVQNSGVLAVINLPAENFAADRSAT